MLEYPAECLRRYRRKDTKLVQRMEHVHLIILLTYFQPVFLYLAQPLPAFYIPFFFAIRVLNTISLNGVIVHAKLNNASDKKIECSFLMAIWSFGAESGGSPPEKFTPSTQLLAFPDQPAQNGLCSSALPRLEVGCLDSPPLSHSLRFSGLFNDLDLSGDAIHRSLSMTLDMSYDIQNFTNIRDIDPEWDDDEVDELVIMSPKLPSMLSTIPEDLEPSPVMTYPTTLSDFEILDTTCVKYRETKALICRKKKTGKMYKIRCRRVYDHFPWTEKDILEILRDLEAPFFPHMRSSFQEDDHQFLVLDHASTHTLRDLVDRQGSLGSHSVLFYASEIITALLSLQSAGIMHRNLNPDDVALDIHGHILITNFEFAEFIGASGTNNDLFNTPLLCGPVLVFQAPEILLQWAHDAAVDCWGFGMLLYFMYFGKHPFLERNDPRELESLKRKVIQGYLSTDALRLVHPQVRDLIIKCLERNPGIRLSVERIKKHEYFSGVSWTKVLTKQVEVPPFPIYIHTCSGHEFFGLPSLTRGEPNDKAGKQQCEVSSLSGELERFLSIDPSISPPAVRESDGPTHMAEVESEPRCSESATLGHRQAGNTNIVTEEIVPSQPMLDFWDMLEHEDQASVISTSSAEFGKNLRRAFLKTPKLRKHRSSIYPRQFLSNLSNSSFHYKLRRKQKSTGMLREQHGSETTIDLPTGVEHIGSGIGFTYNLPVANRSKASICTSTPRSCHNLFQSGFSVSALGLGIKSTMSRSKLKTTAAEATTPSVACDNETPHTEENEGETSTFLRDMYRSPSWILSPPTSLPSPMALTTGGNVKPSSTSTTPMSSVGPFTPATITCDDEVQTAGVLEKELAFEGHNAVNVVEEKAEADLTLRLVVPNGFRLSRVMSTPDQTI